MVNSVALGLALCFSAATAQEIGNACFDHKDNDHDGTMDCQDEECLAVPANAKRCAALANKKVKVGNMVAIFKVAKLTSFSGTYSANMIKECSKLGMKPVCDHPSYCKNDKAALYLGQKGHLGYPPHRNNAKLQPKNFKDIERNSYSATNWDGLCYYTGHANKAFALCNTPKATHSWKSPTQYNPGFMCGKQVSKTSAAGKETHRQCFDHKDNDGDGRSDCQDPDCLSDRRIRQRCMMEQNKAVKLGKGAYGLPAHMYRFKQAPITRSNGDYSTLMIAACKKLGMKPICDHPSYCRKDSKALYIGQQHHLGYPPHRNNKHYTPDGFSSIEFGSFSANSWQGLCFYTGTANKGKALCNIPKTTHSWKSPAQARPGVMCGVQLGVSGKTGVQACPATLHANACAKVGCCSYNRRTRKCQSAVGNKQCTSAQGLYLEAYDASSDVDKQWKFQKLADIESNVLGTVWNNMKPKVAHPGFNHDLWFENDKAFVKDIPSFTLMDKYMMRWRGEINIVKGGLYKFQTESDDGSRLYIDKTMVVDNDGLHGMTKKEGTIRLKVGWHKITVTFFENGGFAGLKCSIMLPKYHCPKRDDIDGKKDGICGGVYRKITADMTKPFQWDARAKKYDSIFDGCNNWFDGCNKCTRKGATGAVQCTKRRCWRAGKAECRGYAKGCNSKGCKGGSGH